MNTDQLVVDDPAELLRTQRSANYQAAGYRAVKRGQLAPMRERLGFSLGAMAEALNTSSTTYETWENGTATIRASTAERIGRFLFHANTQLSELWHRSHVRVKKLTPLRMVSAQLGVPQEVLMVWYRKDLFEAEDLGILGLWVKTDDLPKLALMLK